MLLSRSQTATEEIRCERDKTEKELKKAKTYLGKFAAIYAACSNVASTWFFILNQIQILTKTALVNLLAQGFNFNPASFMQTLIGEKRRRQGNQQLLI